MDHSDDHQHGASGLVDCAEYGHQHRAQAVRAEADGRRRVEVITGPERRRSWSPELKAQITAESLAPGVNVSRIARQYGVSVGLLHYWRRCVRDSAEQGEMRFVPVLAGTGAGPAVGARASSIEIEVAGVCIRINGAVDATALRTVMAVVRAGA